MEKRIGSMPLTFDWPPPGAPLREPGRIFMRRPRQPAPSPGFVRPAGAETAAAFEPGRDRIAPAAKRIPRRGAMLDELVRTIGADGASRLIEAFGGARLYIPHSPEPGDALSAAVGHATALALAGVFGGDRIDVPNPPPRRVRILQMRARGASVDSIALALGCTRRRVFQVLAEARTIDRER